MFHKEVLVKIFQKFVLVLKCSQILENFPFYYFVTFVQSNMANNPNVHHQQCDGVTKGNETPKMRVDFIHMTCNRRSQRPRAM